jgi:divalent metal cation (Fe/Co/Zn/Cd) transporter
MRAEKAPSPPAASRKEGLRRGYRLEIFSISWNVLETVVGMAAGLAAGSVALVGFALDSVVEGLSASFLLWRLHSEAAGRRTAEEAERRAIRLVALAFFALAAYIGIRSVYDLATEARPEESLVGVILAIVSLIVMPVLAWRKRRLAAELNSRALQADSKQTTLCTYLSAFLLIGLAANSLFGWWWADPLAGIAIALVAVNEGRELWSADELGC